MKPHNRFLWWTPRILGILAIIFISLFAFDAFSEDSSFWQNLAGFFLHLIPSFALIALLIFAWKQELWGGIAFTVLGLFFVPLIFNVNNRPGNTFGQTLGITMMVTLPFIVIGILFIVSHYMNKRHGTGEQQP